MRRSADGVLAPTAYGRLKAGRRWGQFYELLSKLLSLGAWPRSHGTAAWPQRRPQASVRVVIAHFSFVRTSLGTAELKSIPTNQTRLASKMDPARRRSASAGGRRKSGGVRRRVHAHRSVNFSSAKAVSFSLIVCLLLHAVPVTAQISK